MSLTMLLVIGLVILLSGLPVVCCMLSSSIRQADDPYDLDLETFDQDPAKAGVRPAPRLA